MKPNLIYPVRVNTLPLDDNVISGKPCRPANILYLQQLQQRYRSFVPIKDLNPSDEKPRVCPINRI
jgi:hypothetical protein